MEAYDENFFISEGASSKSAASKMIPLVMDIVDIKSVLDVGCGVGMFLRTFMERGVTDIQGLDGDYVPLSHRRVPPENFRAHDLKMPLNLNRRFDLVMTLEVAEHLPDSSAENFVTLLCEHGDVVLFSAAIPGQGGKNHINEQWQDYWAAKFAARGYRSVDYMRPRLWDDKDVDPWYRQNTLFFANPKGLEKNPRLAEFAARAPKWGSLNMVHPELYLSKMDMLRSGHNLTNAVQQFLNNLHQLRQVG